MLSFRWRSWLRRLFRPAAHGSVRRRTLKRNQPLAVESLETRVVPAVTLYVDNPGDFTITTDQGTAGLDNGDTVTWTPGVGSAHGGPVSGLIFGSTAFGTVQSAVNAAMGVDTIRVAGGLFSEQVDILGKAGLTLLGNQAGVDARTRSGPETVVDDSAISGRTSFFVRSSGVTLDGFTVQGNTNGNQFGYGILLGAGTSGSKVLNNIVQNNIIGLGLANNSAANQTVIQQNLFRNNNNTGPARGNAIYTDEFVAGGALTNVLIDNNTFTGHVTTALNLSSTTAGSQSNITFSNNLVTGNARAVFARNLLNSTFSNNTVSGSTSATATAADFQLGGGVQNVNVTGNSLSGGAGDAVRVAGTGNSAILVENNSISGYAGDGLEIVSGAYTGSLDAAGNWWGSASGPATSSNPAGTGESIVDPSGQVDYSPWLTTGTDTAPFTAGFQGDFSKLTVNPGSPRHSGQTAFNLQEGVDEVTTGGTVTAVAGTYNEVVSLNKAVTVLGAQAGVDARGPRGPESIVSNATGAFQIVADNVTLDGFTIRDVNSGLSAGVSIAPFASGYQVLNNIITNNLIGIFANSDGAALIKQNLFDANNTPGSSGGAAIYSEITSGLVIDSNEFKNHTLNNPLLFAAVSTTSHTNLSVLNNSLHNNSFGVFALAINGGLFKGNTITGVVTSAALTFGGANQHIDVLENSLTGNQRGLRIQDFGFLGATPNSDIEAHSNNFSGNTQYGLGIVGSGAYTSTFDASGNWWGTSTGPLVGTNPGGTGAAILDGGLQVDYSPWLETGVDVSAAAGFQGDFGKLIVNLGSPRHANQFGSNLQDGANLVAPGGTVTALAGTYVGSLSLNKSLTLKSAVPGTVTVMANSADNQVVLINADGVTVQGLNVVVDRTFTAAGIVALNRDDVVVRDNIVTLVPNGATSATFVSPLGSTSSVGIAVLSGVGLDRDVTVEGNVVGDPDNGLRNFNRAVWLREVDAVVGGPSASDGNTLFGLAQDLLYQFAFGPSPLIQNNTFLGAGVDLTEPNAPSQVQVLDNDFAPVSPLFSQSLLIKRNFNPGASVLVEGNTFTGHTRGILSGGSQNVTIRGNEFTAASGLTEFRHIEVNTAVPGTNVLTPSLVAVNEVTIVGNTFNAQAGPGLAGTAIGFFNGLPGIVSPDFGDIVLGGAGADANVFKAGLAEYIYLDDPALGRFDAAEQITSPPAGSRPAPIPFAFDIDATGNIFAVTGGEFRPADMTLDQQFELEAFIEHRTDNPALGFVEVVADTVFVQSVGETGDTPTATDNDYTRIRNALDAVDSGDTILLRGTFDWTEANAAASWAKGNDGVAGNADDYSILVRDNLNGVTLKADVLGEATIQGPGDVATENLEGFLVFDGGDNQNWTIANLEIFDFDLGIGMFAGSGGSDAFQGTTITGNHIRVATDLNAVAAPADVSQNIGIHYSFGKNQTISDNVIEIPGAGVSDPSANLSSNRPAFSTTVGMQSNTSGGDAYDGLEITGNTIRVLNFTAANRERVIGIWENAHAHLSNILVANNQFLNLDPDNNSFLNLQQAFWITSHSGAATTVTYSGNHVEGASIGFKWLGDPEFPGQNFSAQQAVRLWGNTLVGNNTGVLIQSGGAANLFQNSITGSGLGGAVNVVNGRLTGSGPVTSAVEQNDLSGGAGDAIILGVTSSVTGGIFNNNLDTADKGIRNIGAGLVNASGNYWGSAAPSVVAAQAGTNVDFTPWLNTGTDTSPAAPGFQGNFGDLTVDDSSPQTGGLPYIQEGINLAAAGGTLTIANGLYKESNSTIDRSLTVQGQSRTGVVIAPAAVDQNLDSSFGGIFQHGFIVAANDVTVQTLTIDGKGNTALGTGNNFRAGVITDFSADFSGLTVTDTTVKNIFRRGIQVSTNGTGNEISGNSVDNVSGAGGSIAIAVFGGDTVITGNTISNSTTGIAANSNDSVVFPLLTIRGNSITTTLVGMNLAAIGNGSFVGGPSAGDGNDIDLSALSSADLGILVTFAPGTVTVQGNEITAAGGDTGIALFLNEVSPVQVIGNVLTSTGSTSANPGEGAGIYTSDDPTFFGELGTGASKAVIQGNTVTGFAVGIDVARTGTATGGPKDIDVTIGGTTAGQGNTISGPAAATAIRLVDGNGTDPGNVSATIKGNNLSGVGFYIVNQTPAAIDATGNTFDAADNFRIEDRIVHAVDDLDNGLVTFVAGQVFVTAPGAGSTDSSVQRGVDAATADFTVNLEAATYSEAVTIGKSLTLQGTGSTLSAPTPGSGTGLTITGDTVAVVGLSIQGFATALVASGATRLDLTGVSSSGNTSGGSITGTDEVNLTTTDNADTIDVDGADGLLGTNLLQALGITDVDTIDIFALGGGDTINVAPPAAGGTAISIDGGDPSTGTGDTLVYDAQGEEITQVGSPLTATDLEPVAYTGIETFQFVNNVGNVPVVGTGGDDEFRLFFDPVLGPSYQVNDGPIVALGGAAEISFEGLAGNDRLIVDPTGGDPIPAGGVSFVGGADNDSVSITFGGSMSLNADGLTTAEGTVNLDGVESVTVTGGAGANTLTIDSSGGDPLPSGGVTFVGGGGTDTVEASADGDFSLSDTSLTTPDGTVTLDSVEQADLTGGAGDNSFTVDGWSGQVSLDGGAGDDSATVRGTAAADGFNVNGTQVAVGTVTVDYDDLEVLTVDGQDGADTFTVTPAVATQIVVHGGDPTSTPDDDDQLFVVPAGATGLGFTGDVNSGEFTFTDRAAVTFSDVENMTPAIKIEVIKLKAREGAPGMGKKARFKITRLGVDLSQELDVNYTIGGTARAGRHYKQLSGTVKILAGESFAFVDVVAKNNTTPARRKTVILTLVQSGNPNAVVLAENTGTVNVINDD